MSQQPFSRPGAIDLSGLKRPAAPRPAGGPPAGGPGGAGGAGGAGGPSAPGAAPGTGSYSVEVTQETFQQVVEASLTAPVMLVFYSPSRLAESQQMAQDVATVAEEYEGRFLAGLVDIDAQPAIAQAVQLPQVPYVFLVVDGRPQPMLQDLVGLDELRGLLNQVMQQLTAQGLTGRHQPRSAATAAATDDQADGEPPLDPRYAPAQDALEAGDYAGAVAEYEKLVKANPADSEAAAGLAMARVLHRTDGADGDAVRAAADAAPDDLAAQTLAADVDLLEGRVEDAFSRLVELVRRTTDAERNQAREHLLGLFAAVGNEDPRVLAGRRALASALF